MHTPTRFSVTFTAAVRTVARTVAVAALVSSFTLPSWLMPSGTSAGTFWTDDFEAGLDGWSAYDGAGPGSIEVVTEQAHSGSHSLRLHYVDLGAGVGPFIDRYSQRTTNMYVRAWIKSSPGFVYSGSATKLSYSPRGDNYPSCLLNTQGSPVPFIGCQGVPNNGTFSNDFMQFASSQASISTAWHCVEWQVNYGSVGQNNGVVRIWWDDNLVAEKTGIPFLASYADMYLVRMYRERGLGDIYWDDFSVGDTRQGCSGSAASSDQPPGPPASPRIQSVTAN
jgi:hypothetical protein